MARCPDCYKSEGRKYKRGLEASDFPEMYDRYGRRIKWLDWATLDGGPCDKCNGTGISPEPN
jgi:hypothetical protein